MTSRVWLNDQIYYDGLSKYYLTGEVMLDHVVDHLFPVSVCLQVNRGCNWRCLHCSESDYIDTPTDDYLVSVMQALRAAGVNKLLISGGEPLLHPKIKRLLRSASDLFSYTALATNGSLVNKTNINWITDSLKEVRFSIYGNRQVHDKVTGIPGSYDQVWQAVELAAKHNIKIRITSVVFRFNKDEIYNLASRLSSMGVNELVIFNLHRRGRARQAFDKLYCDVGDQWFKKVKWPIATRFVDWSIDGIGVITYPDGNLYSVPQRNLPNSQLRVGRVLSGDIKDKWLRIDRRLRLHYWRHRLQRDLTSEVGIPDNLSN